MRARWAAVWIPVLLSIALYAPTLRYGLTFDDLHQESPPDRAGARSLVPAWTTPYWGNAAEGGLYRPVLSTTFRLEEAAHFPLAARHGLNVALNAAVAGLLALLLLRLGLGSLAAGLAGSLFALHPAHVEAVAGIVGRAELLAALLMLAAVLLHDRTPGGRAAPFGGSRRSAFLWAAPLAFLAAGTKESAWALPVFVAAVDLARKRSLRQGVPAWAGYAVGIGTHLVLRRAVLGGWLNAAGASVLPFDNPLVSLHGPARVIGGLRVAGLNLAHLLFPVTLAPDYSGNQIAVTGPAYDPRLWGGVLLLAGSAAVVLWGRRRLRTPEGRTAFVGGAWLLVSSLMVMNLVFTVGTVLADRLLYWPSAAMAALAGAGVALVRARARRPAAVYAAASVLVLVGGAYAVRAAAYLPAWHDDLALFREAVKASPRAPRAWFNLARNDQDLGMREEALAAYRRAVELDPGYEEAWAQLASVYLQQGEWEKAKAPLDRALALNPGDLIARTNQAVIWLNTGEPERAAEQLREVLRRDPARTEAAYDLGLAEDAAGRFGAAAEAWKAYLARVPDDPQALNNLAWDLAAELGRPGEAEAPARQAVALAPGIATYWDTLSEALFRQGKADEALDAARRAASIDTTAYYRNRLDAVRAASDSTR